ncbi:MAG: SDR family oxidoreductase [Rickettsiales bacterium]
MINKKPEISERKAVIITGGAKRIGAAIALYMADKGFDIALHYNSSKSEAIKLQNKIRKTGVNCELFKADLSKYKNIVSLVKNIKKKMPNCYILVNNASVFERCEFLGTDEKFFDRQFDINFKAPFFLSQQFAASFAHDGMSVINMIDSDISGNKVSHFAYLLSKKTLAEFTKMAAVSLGKDIKVNAICPGSILPSGKEYKGYMEKVRKSVPLKIQPQQEEIAEAIFWLVTQPSITGQIINIDGGKHVTG